MDQLLKGGVGSRSGLDVWSSGSSTRLSGGGDVRSQSFDILEQVSDVVAGSVLMGSLVIVASCAFRALGFGMAFFRIWSWWNAGSS
jgi:hypothetical protein